MGMYSMPPDRMQQLADAGFDWAGPFYPGELELTPDRMQAATDAGLGVIHPVGRHHRGSLGRDPLPQTPELARGEIIAQIEELSEHPNIASWYLLPEELRPTEPMDCAYMEVAAGAIAASDPKGRPISHYQPNGRRAPGLSELTWALDWVTKGTYVNFMTHQDRRAWVRWSVEQVLSASAADQLPICTLEMFQQPAAEHLPKIPDWVFHDAFCALLCGARALWVFSGWQRPNFEAYDTYFDAYRDVARVLNGPLRVGRSILCGGRRFSVPVLYGPERVEVPQRRLLAREEPSVIAVREQRRDSETIVLVNSANEGVRVRPPGAEGALELLGRSNWDDVRGVLELPPLGVAALRRYSTTV